MGTNDNSLGWYSGPQCIIMGRHKTQTMRPRAAIFKANSPAICSIVTSKAAMRPNANVGYGY
eukprot:6196830-Pleurochrysis_carterae.AAC.3